MNINELDPSLWFVNDEIITSFLSVFDHTYMHSRKPEGPSYLVMDNFLENLQLEMDDLKGARDEAEFISRDLCKEFEQEYRCDVLTWLKGYLVEERPDIKHFSKI